MPGKSKQTEQNSTAKGILKFVKNLLFALIAALLIKTFLIETSRVPTGSMEGTIRTGDFLFVNKFIFGTSSPRNIPFTNIRLPYFQLPGFREPERKDIVVFEYPGSPDVLLPEQVDNYVKRCVGVPGDTIEIKDRVLYVNGEEFWIPPNIRYATPYSEPAGKPRFDIWPDGEGWNRDNYGPLYVPRRGDIIPLDASNVKKWRTIIDREYGEKVVSVKNGKVYIENEPADSYILRDDYYFMLGDNRDESLDSRFWGFVPERNVLGEAFMVYWSWNSDLPGSDLFGLLASVRPGRIAKLVN